MNFLFPKRPLGQSKTNAFSNLIYPNLGSVSSVKKIAGSITINTCGYSAILGESNLQSIEINTCGYSTIVGELNLQSVEINTCGYLIVLGELNLQSVEINTCGYSVILGEL